MTEMDGAIMIQTPSLVMLVHGIGVLLGETETVASTPIMMVHPILPIWVNS
jgi:hypothetical protein